MIVPVQPRPVDLGGNTARAAEIYGRLATSGA
jgi:hypothetical protein